MTITLTEKVVETKMVSRTIEHHELVRELCDDILAYGPEHFDMKSWWQDPHGHNGLEGILNGDIKAVNACGTTGCLAGHATVYANTHGLALHSGYQY